MQALWDGSDAEAAALLKEGVDLDELPLISPILHVAAESGLLSTVQVLLQPLYSLQPNLADGVFATPLHSAACHGRQPVAKALLDAGASERSSSRGRQGAPLDCARRRKQPADFIRMLEVGVCHLVHP